MRYAGNLEDTSGGNVTGWAVAMSNPGEPCFVKILVDREVIALVATSMPRGDVEQRYKGAFYSGFWFRLPGRYLDGTIHLVSVLDADNRMLGAPVVIQHADPAAAGQFTLDRFNASLWLSAGDGPAATLDEGARIRISISDGGGIQAVAPARTARLAENRPDLAGSEFHRRYRTRLPYGFTQRNALVNVADGNLYAESGLLWASTAYLRGPEAVVRDAAMIRDDRRGIARHRGKFILFSTAMRSNYFHWHVESLASIFMLRSWIAQGWTLLCGELNAWQDESVRLLAGRYRSVPAASVIEIEAIGGCCHIDGRSLFPDANVEKMFQFLRAAVGPSARDADPGGARIFVSRADASTRRMRNEDPLYDALAPLGFQRVVLSEISYSDQIRLFRAARVVVGSHGAGLTNLGFCPPGCAIVEIAPEDYINPCFRYLAILRGLSHVWYISGSLGAFVVDVPDFVAFLKRHANV